MAARCFLSHSPGFIRRLSAIECQKQAKAGRSWQKLAFHLEHKWLKLADLGRWWKNLAEAGNFWRGIRNQ
jgi:hypothetical protein